MKKQEPGIRELANISASKPKKVAVVGAGIAGLSCAYELTKKGVDVEVFEKEEVGGGRTKTVIKSDILLDIGAIVLSSSDRLALEYVSEFGIPNRLLTPQKFSFYIEKEIHTFDPKKQFRSFLSFIHNPFDVFKCIFFILLLTKKINKLSKNNYFTNKYTEIITQTAKNYLYKKVGRHLTDTYIDALFCGGYFQTVEEISAFAAVHQICQKVLPTQAAMINGYYQLSNGMGTLAEALENKIKCRRGYPILSIERHGKQILLTGKKEKQLFDLVVIATSRNATQEIYRDPTENQKTLLDQVSYGSTVTLYFFFPMDFCIWEGPIFISKKENPVIAFISTPDQKNRKPIVSMYLQDSFAKDNFSKSDQEIFSLTKKAFGDIFPKFATRLIEIEDLYLHRWEEAIPKYTPTSILAVDKFWKNGQGEENVYLAGDYLNTPFIEGSIFCGKKIANMIQLSR